MLSRALSLTKFVDFIMNDSIYGVLATDCCVIVMKG